MRALCAKWALFGSTKRLRDFLEASNRFPRADLTAIGVERNSGGVGGAPRAAESVGPARQNKNSKLQAKA
jgi:hypothetical protein